MMFLSGFWGAVGAAITDALRSLMLSLCELVYKLIIFFFELFLKISNSSLLDDSVVQDIYQRVGLILGLFMVFRVVFSIIQYVMNPDMMFDKQKGLGNIVKKVFIVIILLGTMPYVFDLAYDVQDVILRSNVIPKIITGKNVGMENFGGTLAEYTFTSFYRFDGDTTESDRNNCGELFNGILSEDLKRNSSLRYAYNCVNVKGGSGDNQYYIIQFDGHGVLALLVGCLILWMIIMYVIQVGVRVVQLAYLELIAPIPIIGYLAPKGDDTFNKWFKQCTTTYFDLFIRVAVIYLVVFIVQLLIKNDSQHFVDSLGNTTGWDMKWINIVMIIALLIFAKKVPALFKELFPMSGGAAKFDLGLKAPKEAKQVFGTIAGAATGAAVGLIGGPGVGGRVKGLIGGVLKGGYSGAKGKKLGDIASARAAQNVRNRQLRDSDSTFGGRLDASLRNTFGLESATEAIDRQIHDIDMNDIRPIDDRIAEIDRDPIMETKRRNDAIIGARKAMIDEAEKELLKSGSGDVKLREMKARLDWARNDIANGGMTTSEDIIYMEDTYKEALDTAAADWIDANSSTNGVVISNMRKISNETGTNVTTAGAAADASKKARQSNNDNASAIADLEYEKQELGRSKRHHEQRKGELSRAKEIPQANEKFANKKGGK